MATKKVKTSEPVSIGETAPMPPTSAKGKHSSAHRPAGRARVSKTTAPAATPPDAASEAAAVIPAPEPAPGGSTKTPAKKAAAKSTSKESKTAARKASAPKTVETPTAEPTAKPRTAIRTRKASATVTAAEIAAPEPVSPSPAMDNPGPALKPEPSLIAAEVAEIVTPAQAEEPATVVTLDKESFRDEIAQLAYHLWVEGGRRHGRDHEDWAEAERRVLSRYQIA